MNSFNYYLFISVIFVPTILWGQEVLTQNQRENVSQGLTDTKLVLPSDYRDLTIEQVEIKGVSVKEILDSRLTSKLRNLFLNKQFSQEILTKAKVEVQKDYNMLGYPYVVLNNVFLKKKPEKKAWLTVLIKENPVSRLQIQGTHRKRSVIEMLNVSLGKPYNAFEMEKRTKKLFASDLFSRYFSRVVITPYYLENETMMLGIYVYEKNVTQLISEAGDAGQKQIYIGLSVRDPEVYGTNNHAELAGKLGFFEKLTSWQIAFGLGDLYNFKEKNKIRYELQTSYRDHTGLTNGFNQFQLDLYYAWHFQPAIIPPIYWGIGYQWFIRNQSLGHHIMFTRFYYNSKQYEIYSVFHHLISLDLGYQFARVNGLEEDPQKIFSRGKVSLWQKPSSIFWLNYKGFFYFSADELADYSQAASLARWDVTSPKFASVNITAFYRNYFFMVGPFIETLWSPDHKMATGLAIYLLWLNFVTTLNIGYRPTELFAHINVNGTF